MLFLLCVSPLYIIFTRKYTIVEVVVFIEKNFFYLKHE